MSTLTEEQLEEISGAWSDVFGAFYACKHKEEEQYELHLLKLCKNVPDDIVNSLNMFSDTTIEELREYHNNIIIQNNQS